MNASKKRCSTGNGLWKTCQTDSIEENCIHLRINSKALWRVVGTSQVRPRGVRVKVRAEANALHIVTVGLPLKRAHSEYACGTEIQKTWKQGFQSAAFLATSSQLARWLTFCLCRLWLRSCQVAATHQGYTPSKVGETASSSISGRAEVVMVRPHQVMRSAPTPWSDNRRFDNCYVLLLGDQLAAFGRNHGIKFFTAGIGGSKRFFNLMVWNHSHLCAWNTFGSLHRMCLYWRTSGWVVTALNWFPPVSRN